tara:strand:+ start:486 stop:650 length:165 start_codon:yes stop_codon:yes gene_type:complete
LEGKQCPTDFGCRRKAASNLTGYPISKALPQCEKNLTYVMSPTAGLRDTDSGSE